MDNLQTADGLTLVTKTWAPAPSLIESLGTVLIVHGLGEHCARYGHVAGALTRAGWHVVSYDQRGHGQSGGARGDVATLTSLLEDLSLVIDAVRSNNPRKLVLLGHSMGGAVVGRYVLDDGPWKRPVDGMVLSSPALAADLNPIQKLLLAIAPSLAPHKAVKNGLDPQYVAREKKAVKLYMEDPLVHPLVAPLLAKFIVDAGTLVREKAVALAVPTLLMFAGQDKLVAPRGSREFLSRVPAGVLQHKCYDAMYHEIFNDPEKEQPLNLMVEWLKTRMIG
jgi:alpha-beta hydrolase superfamily lysophospholipase